MKDICDAINALNIALKKRNIQADWSILIEDSRDAEYLYWVLTQESQDMLMTPVQGKRDPRKAHKASGETFITIAEILGVPVLKVAKVNVLNNGSTYYS